MHCPKEKGQKKVSSSKSCQPLTSVWRKSSPRLHFHEITRREEEKRGEEEEEGSIWTSSRLSFQCQKSPGWTRKENEENKKNQRKLFI